MSLIFRIEKVLFKIDEWVSEEERESYLLARNLKTKYGNQKQNPVEDGFVVYR